MPIKVIPPGIPDELALSGVGLSEAHKITESSEWNIAQGGLRDVIRFFVTDDIIDKLKKCEFNPELPALFDLFEQKNPEYSSKEAYLSELAQSVFFSILIRLPNLEELIFHVTPETRTEDLEKPKYSTLHKLLEQAATKQQLPFGKLERLTLVPVTEFVIKPDKTVTRKGLLYWSHLQVLPLIRLPSVRKLDLWGCNGVWRYPASVLEKFGYPQQEDYLKQCVAHIEHFRFRDIKFSEVSNLDTCFLRHVKRNTCPIKSLDFSCSRMEKLHNSPMRHLVGITPHLDKADEINMHTILPAMGSLQKLAICGPYATKDDIRAHFGSNQRILTNLASLKELKTLALPSFALFGSECEVSMPIDLPPQLTHLEIIEDGFGHVRWGEHEADKGIKLYSIMLEFASQANRDRYKPLSRVTLSRYPQATKAVRWTEEEVQVVFKRFQNHRIFFEAGFDTRNEEGGVKNWFVW